MGASLPLLVRSEVANAPSAGRTIGLLYGINMLGANQNLYESRGLLDAVATGARLVVVDPAFTATAARAQEWVPIAPGTDGALLFRYNLIRYVDTRGNVFPEHPLAATPPNVPVTLQFFDDSVKVDPDWPLGWAFSNRTIGNVVDAKEDWDGDDEINPGSRAFDVAPGQPYFFDFPWSSALADLTETPRHLAQDVEPRYPATAVH